MGIAVALTMLVAAIEPAPIVEDWQLIMPATAATTLNTRTRELVVVPRGQPLSKKAVRASIEALYATGNFSEILVTIEPHGSGVMLVFDAVPKQSVVQVFVEGNRLLTKSEILAAGRLVEGMEFWPERLAQAAEAVAELYRRRGFLSVSVEPQTDWLEEGPAVGLIIEEGPVAKLASLALVGEPRLELTELKAASKLEVGDALDSDVIQKGAQALEAYLRKRHYFRARVDPPLIQSNGHVVIPIVAGPRFDFVFSGNRSFSDDALSAVLSYSGDELLDEGLAERMADTLRKFYRFRSFHDAEVHARLKVRGDRAALAFEIVEGESIAVVDVTLNGNVFFSDAELSELVARAVESNSPERPFDAHASGDPSPIDGRVSQPKFAEFPDPPYRTVLDDDSCRDAAQAMLVLYRRAGFLQAEVELSEIAIDGRKAYLRYRVVEGQRSFFRKIELVGAPTAFQSDAVSLITSKDPFSGDALESLRQRVVRELGRAGYLYASVEASAVPDLQAGMVDATLTIASGPRVYVRRILAVGNLRTFDDVILRQAAMKEGAPLDSDSISRTQANLMELGIFRTAEVELLSPDTPEPLKTVLLKVREQARVSGEFGLGYFLAEGPRLVGDLNAPNLGGRAINFSLHGQLNWFAASAPALTRLVEITDLSAIEQLGGRVNMGLQNRGLLPANIGWRLDLIAERVFRPQFHFWRVALVPSVDWTRLFEIPRVEFARLKTTLQLQYELEGARVTPLASSQGQQLPITLVDQQRLRFLEGTFFLQTVRLSPTIDFRDSALVPRKGVLIQGAIDLTGALYTQDESGRPVAVNFMKFAGLITGYVPIFRTVLALSARAGKIVPLAPDSTTPPVRRFFLGGSTTMRGFNEDQLIAEDQRAAYRSQVRDCQVLATKDGCTAAASTIAAGKQVASQGGEYFLLFKVELRFPFFSIFDLALYTEAGNLWLAAPTNPFSLRYVAGAGLRYVTPIGPLAVDVGINLSPDLVINEPRAVVHFNIGVF